MWLELSLLLGGLLALVAGAELFVRKASALGCRLGLSPVVVGLTVVALGTSSPELAVTLGSVFSGQVDVGVGNVVGSNIANLLLVLGIAATITRLAVDRSILRVDLPFMIAATVVFAICSLDGRLDASDGWLLALLFALYLFPLFRRETGEERPDPGAEAGPVPGPTPALLLALGCGMGLLVIGADWMVDGAWALAERTGVEPAIIGMTVVAVGTSLPEIATTLVAIVRGQHAMVIGNAVGSNVLNIVLVLGVSAIVSGGGLEVAAPLIRSDLPWMVLTAFACLPVFLTSRAIVRREGVLLVLGYLAFVASLAARVDLRFPL